MAKQPKRSDNVTSRLLRAIETCGVSRYELSKQSGVAQAALSRFVNGQRGLTLESLDRLCNVLGLELRPKIKAKGN